MVMIWTAIIIISAFVLGCFVMLLGTMGALAGRNEDRLGFFIIFGFGIDFVMVGMVLLVLFGGR